jgi:hypothetical protein
MGMSLMLFAGIARREVLQSSARALRACILYRTTTHNLNASISIFVLIVDSRQSSTILFRRCSIDAPVDPKRGARCDPAFGAALCADAFLFEHFETFSHSGKDVEPNSLYLPIKSRDLYHYIQWRLTRNCVMCNIYTSRATAPVVQTVYGDYTLYLDCI